MADRSCPRLDSADLTAPFDFHYNEAMATTTADAHNNTADAHNNTGAHNNTSAIAPTNPPQRGMYKVKRKRHIQPPPAPQIFPDLVANPDDPTTSVVPTIEMSEADADVVSPHQNQNHHRHQHHTPTSPGLLAPYPPADRHSPALPKTPTQRAPLSFTDVDDSSHEWDMITESRPAFVRANSLCSSFSNSSISSCGSSAFSTLVGSCASPDSVTSDPFVAEHPDKSVLSPTTPRFITDEPSAKRLKKFRHVKWTPAMDSHLENTYLVYIHDPTNTPFKMLPGVVPPLGVCTRVANRARRTWMQHRLSTPTPLDAILEDDAAGPRTEACQGSPDTVRPPPAAAPQDGKPWPRSDAATRKRLRHLVKAKPDLSVYYSRLLHRRSPSPFLTSEASCGGGNGSTATTLRDLSDPCSTSFTARDLKLSLITSTAPSMQPQGPLAQLSSNDNNTTRPEPPPAVRPRSQRQVRPADWFNRIPRSQAHQKSASLQSELSIANADAAAPSAPATAPATATPTTKHTASLLASPFAVAPSDRSHLLNSMTTTQSLGRHAFFPPSHSSTTAAPASGTPSLDSPFHMAPAHPQGDPTMKRSLKRRFKSDEEKPRRPRGAIDDVFGPWPGASPSAGLGGATPAQSSPQPQPSHDPFTRTRGFTVGVGVPGHLSSLFDPLPPVQTHSSSSTVTMTVPQVDLEMPDREPSPPSPLASASRPLGFRSVPRRFHLASSSSSATPPAAAAAAPAKHMPRLGSPFGGGGRVVGQAGGAAGDGAARAGFGESGAAGGGAGARLFHTFPRATGLAPGFPAPVPSTPRPFYERLRALTPAEKQREGGA